MAVQQRQQAGQSAVRVAVGRVQPDRLVYRHGRVQAVHRVRDGGQAASGERVGAEWVTGQPAHRHGGGISGEVGGPGSGSKAGGVPVEQAQAAPLAAVLAPVIRAEALDDDVGDVEQVGGHGE